VTRSRVPSQPALTKEQKAERVVARLRKEFHASALTLDPIPIPKNKMDDIVTVINNLYAMSQALEPHLTTIYMLSESTDATKAQVYQVGSSYEIGVSHI
jgi:hypothetical protein